jgi:hypothetical protein
MANQLLPFRQGTRQRRAKVGVIPFAAASAGNPLELPRVGMLSRIIVQLRGTITYSAPGALADLGPWNLLSRIRVNTNIGAASIVDLSGYGAYVAQRQIAYGWSPEKAGIGDATPNADLHAFPLSGAAQAFALTWELPVGANDGPNFETGLINLQAPETRVTLEPVFGALLDPATLVTAIVANLHVYYEYYEIGDPGKFALPPLALVRLLEDQQAVGQTGDNTYTVPRQGTLLNLAHVAILNGARSDSIDSFSIKFNKTDTAYNIERQWSRMEERQLYGLLPVTGVYYNDWFHAYGEPNKGDTRDAIDSEALTTLESIVTVSSGATLGSNNNFLRSIRRIVQVLQ